jgi:hypothetical protein
MRIVFTGDIDFSQVLLEKALTLPAQFVGIVTYGASSSSCDFCCLEPGKGRM